MALTKPPVLPAWAESGDKVQPSNAEIQTGWPLSNVPPARQRWNWLLNFLANAVRYLTRRGVPDYGADEVYMTGDRVIGDDGKTYRSIQDTNTGNTPSSSPTWWERWGYTATELQDALNSKEPAIIVRVASTVAINLAAPGANIDGVVMVAGDLFLEKDNGTGANRGIYVWNGAAVAATRAPEADTGVELKPGMLIAVAEGTTQADSVWMLTTDGAITVGVTGLTFAFVAGNTGFAKTNAVNTFTKGQIGAVVALVDGATITPDFSLGNNFEVTLAGNRTLANPTTLVAGQSGIIRVAQDATGGRTLAFGAYWKFTGGGVPSLTGTASAVDLIAYHVETATRISAVFHGDMK